MNFLFQKYKNNLYISEFLLAKIFGKKWELRTCTFFTEISGRLTIFYRLELCLPEHEHGPRRLSLLAPGVGDLPPQLVGVVPHGADLVLLHGELLGLVLADGHSLHRAAHALSGEYKQVKI